MYDFANSRRSREFVKVRIVCKNRERSSRNHWKMRAIKNDTLSEGQYFFALSLLFRNPPAKNLQKKFAKKYLKGFELVYKGPNIPSSHIQLLE